jgi:hypothetical protein
LLNKLHRRFIIELLNAAYKYYKQTLQIRITQRQKRKGSIVKYLLHSRIFSVSSSNCLLCLFESLIFSNFWNPFLWHHIIPHNQTWSHRLHPTLHKMNKQAKLNCHLWLWIQFLWLKWLIIYIRENKTTNALTIYLQKCSKLNKETKKIAIPYDNARKISAICPSISASSSLIADKGFISQILNTSKNHCFFHTKYLIKLVFYTRNGNQNNKI